MAYIRWKVINGNGPYAYLVESVRDGDKVESRHLAYLGTTVNPGATVDLARYGRKGQSATVPVRPAPGLGATQRDTSKPGVDRVYQRGVPYQHHSRGGQDMTTQPGQSEDERVAEIQAESQRIADEVKGRLAAKRARIEEQHHNYKGFSLRRQFDGGFAVTTLTETAARAYKLATGEFAQSGYEVGTFDASADDLHGEIDAMLA